MSIKAKLLIFALSISLIPIFIITTLYYFNARSTIEKQTLDWLTAVAESRRIHTMSFLEAKKERVIDFSSDVFIRDNLDTISHRGSQSNHASIRLSRHLVMNKIRLDRHIAAISILDINGKVIASTNGGWIGEDMSDKEVFIKGMSKIHVVQPEYHPELNESYMYISAPITSRLGNETTGVIVNAYDIAFLSEITSNRAGMGKTGEVLLGMRSGDNVVFLTSLRYASDKPLSKSIPVNSFEAEPMRLALKGGAGAIIAPDYRGINVVAAYQYIPNMDWGLVAKIDKEEVYAPIVRMRIFTIILGSISAIVVVLVAINLSQRVTKPIQRLVEGTRRIASGDLDFKIITRSKDEVGYLANSFNDMTSQLGESKKQVEDYAQNLEQKVEDKTEEVRKSKEYVENLIETAQDAIISIDEKGIVSIWNKLAEKIFGYSRYEIIGKPITVIIPERYEKQYEEGLRRFLKTGKARIMGSTIKFFGITKEGIEIPIEMSLAFQKNEKGRYSFTVIIRDMTERKKQEEEIQKLSYALEQSPVSVVITDTEGNIEYVNKKFTQVTGYSYEEVIGKNPRVLKSDDRTSEEYRELWETITSGKEWRGEFCNKAKNGAIYWEAASISPVKNDAGVITHFIAVKEDITERRKIEENLRKLSQAVEQSPSSVMITDTEGIIEYINPKFTELTGYTPEEAIGQTPRILKSGKTPLEEYKKLWKAIKSDREWQGEFCNKKKNGVLYWEDISISPVKNDKGKTTHFVAVNEDITERKQMEEKLEKRVEQRTSDIKQLLLQKDAFINQLSHDLKTPLTPLVALLPMVESRINDQETKRMLGLITKNVDYMKILTERTLQLARLNSPSVRLNLERVDILSEIRDIIVNFLPVFEERGIKVVNNTTPPLIVEADRTLIKEVLHNIISNAVKYSNGEGVVTFDNFSDSNNVEILISDNGVGIKMGQLKHVFEEFYKVDDSRHDRSSTGLGLAICKSIIERHGGAIWAESLGSGNGTTVHFTLPTIQGERQKNG